MFCGNCGVENANGAKFCKGCGKPLGYSTEKKIIPPQNNQNTGAGQVQQAVGVPKAGQWKDKVKALPKTAIIGVVIAVVALVAIICVVVKSGSTINLDKYITIEASGYDGYGTAQATVDWDAIVEKYGNKISFSGKASDEYGGLLNYMTPIEVLQECVSVSLDPSSGLSNGDMITYAWDIDENWSKYLKCKIKYKNGSYTVSELAKVDTFDAFADLEVTFDGIAPDGKAYINYTGSELDYYNFSCDKNSGLRNGDKITITIDDSNLEYYAENLGKVPEAMEKTYTVEGLDSYLSKLAEIDEGALTSMQNQASDVFYAYVAKNWGDGADLESFTYIGDYLLTAKSSDAYWDNNILYLIYKAQVRNSYSYEGDSYNKVNNVYWYIGFTNLMVGADGTVAVDVTSYYTPNDRFSIDSGISYGWIGTYSWEYNGYPTLDALYKTVVAANMDSYNHEDNVDESVAPETVVEDTTEAGAEAENDYIFPNSDTELLTDDDLEGLTAEECKIARNEIYARHGRKFKDESLQAYFDALDWYEGTIDPDDFSESILSDIEIANKDLIVAYEEEKGYR